MTVPRVTDDFMRLIFLPLERVERNRRSEAVLLRRRLVLQPLPGEVLQRLVNVGHLQPVAEFLFLVLFLLVFNLVVFIVIVIVVLILLFGVYALWPDLGVGSDSKRDVGCVCFGWSQM